MSTAARAATRDKLIVFVKAPRPGTVKTRLAAALGDDAACLAYRTLVETLLQNLAPLNEVELRYTPDDAAKEIEPWLRAGWKSQPQGDGDLGERLKRAFAESFRNGFQRVVIIGSDCPQVSPQDIAEAWSALGESDVALGPATDGGYWLIGLCAEQPALFCDMPWSMSGVFNETLRRAEELNLKASTLRTLSDVDTLTDWQKFQTERR